MLNNPTNVQLKLTLKELQDLETEMLKEVSEICNRNNISYYLAYGSALGTIRHNGPIPWDDDVDIIIPYPELDRFISTVRTELPDNLYLNHYDINNKYWLLYPKIGMKGYDTRHLHLDVFVLIGAPDTLEEQVEFKKELDYLKNLFLYKKGMFKDFYMYKSLNWKEVIVQKSMKIKQFFTSSKSIIKKFETLCEKYEYGDSEIIVNSFGGYGLKEFTPKSFYGKGVLKNYENLQIRIPEKYDEYLRNFYGDYMKYPPVKQRVTKEFYIIDKV
ncbi:MAG TPA: LicD family protein [Aequorivita sp.]|nr:LicD family protein [Aequorivita sp.]